MSNPDPEQHEKQNSGQNSGQPSDQSAIPSLDRLLRAPVLEQLLARTGRQLVVEEARAELDQLRRNLQSGQEVDASLEGLSGRVEARVGAVLQMSLQAVFNLTGTILHTNLGRAPMAEEAIDAMAAVSRGATNLEFDLTKGKRGDRDD
ncbi:MAG: L-seryl-tRNA(Sec) selenium transferase, partial [Rhodospirillaceae bacterium]|nr:L-seryl-tRNA(Sec) selenium transferase [Rhodospirillaceae bacterium]